MELPKSLWANLPAFGQLYLKPVLFNIGQNTEKLTDFFHFIINEAETTDNEARKLCLETVGRYIYEEITKRTFETNQFKIY